MSLLQKIEPFMKNGVISLKKVKRNNYALYRILLLKDTTPLLQGLELLNDVRRVKKKEEVRKFLKFTFKDVVDITSLRKNNIEVYKYISAQGDIRDVIKSLGFSYTYSSKELVLPEDKKNRAYYNKLYYKAKKLGICVNDLKRELGIDTEVSKEQVEELRKAGFSFKKIAEYLNIGRTSVWRLLNEDR